MRYKYKLTKWIAILAIHFNLIGQKLYNFKVETVLHGTEFLNAEGNITKKFSNDVLFLHLDSVEDCILIQKISLDNTKNKISLRLNYRLINGKDYLIDFDFKNNLAVVLLHKKILLFRLDSDNIYNLIKSSNLDNPYDKCYLNDGEINLFKCYNHHVLDANFATGLSLMDTNLNVIKTKSFETNAIPFTHLVGQYYDYYSGKFILSNALTRKFLIINKNGQIIDSIGNGELMNENLSTIPINYRFDTKTVSPKDTIYKIQKFDRSINRVHKVFYLNDSIILYTVKTSLNKFQSYLVSRIDNNWKAKLVKQKGTTSLKFNWEYSRTIYFYKNKVYFLDAKYTLVPSEDHFKKYPNYYLYSYEYKFKR